MRPALESERFSEVPGSPAPVCGRLRAIRPWNGIPRSGLSTFPWRVGAVLPLVAREWMRIGRLMLARAAASAAVRRSATKSPGTFAGEWRPRPSGTLHKRRAVMKIVLDLSGGKPRHGLIDDRPQR